MTTASSTIFVPNAKDASLQLLTEIFGSAIPHISSGGTTVSDSTVTMLGAAFGYFNSGIIFFGTFILAYMTVFGIANTANDGEALGKKWNTFYTPIRTLISASMTIPGGSGFSGVQIMVLTLVCYSIGFASNMWQAVVSAGLTNSITTSAVSSVYQDNNINNLATTALRMQVCARAVNKALTTVLGPGSALALYTEGPTAETVGNVTTNTTTILYKDPNWPGSETLCGSLTYSTQALPIPTASTPTIANPFESAGVTQATNQLQKTIEDVKSSYIQGLFGLGSIQNPFTNILNQMDAATADGSTSTVSAQDLSNAVTQFRSSMTTQLRTSVQTAVEQIVSSDTQGLSTTLTQGGWIYAGAWHMEISRIMDSVRSASSTHFAFNQTQMNLGGKLSGDALQAAQGIVQQYSKLTSPLINQAIDNIPQGSSEAGGLAIPSLRTDITKDDFSDGSGGVSSMVKKYFYHSYPDSIVTGIVTTLGEDDADPLLQIKKMGDYIVTAVEIGIVAKAALASTTFAIEKGAESENSNTVTGTLTVGLGAIVVTATAALSKFLDEIWSMINFPIYTIMYMGYFMSVWIPMVPFFIFMIGVAGWVVAVIEATIASALWAVMHMTPEDSFIGSQKQGYLLLLSVFCRPALMVFGLTASMAAIGPIIRITNWMFVLNFKGIQSDTATGLFSIAAFLVVYCFLINSILMLLFALPQSLPDRILRWIGAGVGDLGEQNSMGKVEQGASGQARAAMVGAAKQAARKAERDKAERARKSETQNEEKSAAPEGITGQSSVTPDIIAPE